MKHLQQGTTTVLICNWVLFVIIYKDFEVLIDISVSVSFLQGERRMKSRIKSL